MPKLGRLIRTCTAQKSGFKKITYRERWHGQKPGTFKGLTGYVITITTMSVVTLRYAKGQVQVHDCANLAVDQKLVLIATKHLYFLIGCCFIITSLFSTCRTYIGADRSLLPAGRMPYP